MNLSFDATEAELRAHRVAVTVIPTICRGHLLFLVAEIIAVRVATPSCIAPWNFLLTISLKALQTRIAVHVGVTVALTHCTWRSLGTAAATLIIKRDICNAVVISTRVATASCIAARDLLFAVSLKALVTSHAIM